MVSSLPSLPDDKGSVVITHSQGNIVDEVAIRKNGILPRWVKLTNTVNGAIDVTPKAFFRIMTAFTHYSRNPQKPGSD